MDGDIDERKSFSRKEKTLLGGLKGPAIAGLIVMAPFIAISLVLKWVFGLFRGIPGYEFFHLTSYPLLNQFFKAGVITVLAGLFIVGIGKFVSTRKGLRLEEEIDRFFTRLPFIGPVYNITKKATDTVLRRTEDFQHPVKLSYQGIKFTAFQTGKCSENGKKLVFIPTSPNITSGFVVEVDESQIEETDDTLEQAFTRVLSAGFSS